MSNINGAGTTDDFNTPDPDASTYSDAHLARMAALAAQRAASPARKSTGRPRHRA